MNVYSTNSINSTYGNNDFDVFFNLHLLTMLFLVLIGNYNVDTVMIHNDLVLTGYKNTENIIT